MRALCRGMGVGGVLALMACGAEEAEDTAADAIALEEDVLARAASGEGFVQARESAVESLAAEGSFIDVWVSEEAWDEYQVVDPETEGSKAHLPADSMVVRTIVDPAGTVQKHTVLWFPKEAQSVEDLYFLVADPDWNVLTTEGVRQAGYLTSCQGCHATRAEDGFVFGVP
jgi:hypothetical protein